jgi:polygalacturonase
MEADILNARDCGVTSAVGYAETNQIALQRAIDEMCVAGGGTILIPTGVYDFAGPIDVEVSTAPNASGTIRIAGEGYPTLVAQDENSLFVVTDAHNSGAVGHVVLEGLHFRGSWLPA